MHANNRLAPLAIYDTGRSLGVVECTQELIDASRDAGPEGAVPAYQDGDEGPWTYCQPSRVADARRGGLKVVTVYVEDLSDLDDGEWIIECRSAGTGGQWQPEGSGDVYDSEAEAEAAMVLCERTSDTGARLEYRAVER